MNKDDDRFLSARSVGEALRLLRERAGLMRDEAAKLFGVSGGTLSRYESDATAKPDAVALRRIVATLARLLGEDPRRVWDEVGELLDRERAEPKDSDPDEAAALDVASVVVVRDTDDRIGE